MKRSSFFYCLIIYLLSSTSFKTNAQTDTLWQKVWHLYQDGKFDSALITAKQLRHLALTKGDDDYVIKAMSMVAKVHKKQGNIETSVLALYDLLERGKKIKDPGAEGSAYLDLGRIFYDAYDYNTAIDHLKKAHDQYYQANKPNNQSITLYHLARSFLKKRQPDSALHFLNQALIVNPPRYQMLTSSIFNLLGWASFENQLYATARDHYHRSLQYAASDSVKHAVAYHNIGETYLSEGNSEEARTWLNKAMNIKKKLKDGDFTLSTINLLSKLYVQDGDTLKAIGILNKGLAASGQNRFSEEAMNALALMTTLISRLPQTSLSSHELKGYLTTYHNRYQAWEKQKLNLEALSSRQQLKAITKEYQLKKLAGLEKEKKIRHTTGLALAGILILMIMLIRQRRMNNNYKNDKKMMAYATERLQESLLINHSLKKSYIEIHKKYNEDDVL